MRGTPVQGDRDDEVVRDALEETPDLSPEADNDAYDASSRDPSEYRGRVCIQVRQSHHPKILERINLHARSRLFWALAFGLAPLHLKIPHRDLRASLKSSILASRAALTTGRMMAASFSLCSETRRPFSSMVNFIGGNGCFLVNLWKYSSSMTRLSSFALPEPINKASNFL